MAVWADVSHLESPSDEEDNTTEYDGHNNPSTLNYSSEASIQDPSTWQYYTTVTSAGSASDQEKECSVDGSEISVPQDSAAVRSSASATREYDYHHLRNASRPQDPTVEPNFRTTSRKGQTNTDQKPNQLDNHGITFQITSPDDSTIMITPDHEEDVPFLYTADTASAQNQFPYDNSDSHEDFGPAYQQVDIPSGEIDVGETYDGQESIIGLGIETGDTLRHYIAPHTLVVTTEADEKLVFANVNQAEFDSLLATSYARDNAQPANGTLNSSEDHYHWVEFEYDETTQQDIEELRSSDRIIDAPVEEEITASALSPQQRFDAEHLDMYGSFNTSTQYDSEDDELDTSSSPLLDTANSGTEYQLDSSPNDFESDNDFPLFHFQPLPIGPFAPTSPPDSPPPELLSGPPRPRRHHHHPFPMLTHNPATNTINVTHTVDEHWDCSIFVFMRHVASVTRAPVPLSRRVYELQGLAEENRRGLRASIFYRWEWRVVGSPLRGGLGCG